MKKDFYEKSWKKWDDMKQFGPASLHNRRILKKIIAEINFKTLCDIGCGEGSLIMELKKSYPLKKYFGLDVSGQAVIFAKKQAPFGDFFVADIQKKALAKKFDLIVASEILEHLPSDFAALKNMRKMAKKYLLVYTLTGEMRKFEKTVGHVRNYQQNDLIKKIEKSGFKIKKNINWGWPFYSPIYRDILNKTPEKATTGQFGLTRKIISRLIFYLFFFNSWKKGDVIAVLAEVNNTQIHKSHR